MDKNTLQILIDKNYSSYDIARETGKSQTSINYWLRKLSLKTNREQIGRKTSKIWAYTDDEFKNIVNSSNSIAGALREMEMVSHPNNYASFRKRCEALSLTAPKAKNDQFKKITILRKNSTAARSTVKAKILRENLLIYQCQICGLLPKWNGKELKLTLDHINGESTDHRIENLRFVCPNCDRQLETYCNKNWKVKQ